MNDNDIKIFGDKPSADMREKRKSEPEKPAVSADDIKKAKEIGKKVARIYIKDVLSESENNDNAELLMQRQLLLSFTATIGFEQFICNDSLSGIAQKSFLDALKSADKELYKTSSDTGAFSFYYLAFRRETDIERRMGQTFAMLCSHDGDPIFQELGEALYCWFSAEVRNIIDSVLSV